MIKTNSLTKRQERLAKWIESDLKKNTRFKNK